MLRLFEVLILYGVFSAVSMAVVWLIIARKGFSGIESSDSVLTRFLLHPYFSFRTRPPNNNVLIYEYSPQTSNAEGQLLMSMTWQEYPANPSSLNDSDESEDTVNVLEDLDTNNTKGTIAVVRD